MEVAYHLFSTSRNVQQAMPSLSVFVIERAELYAPYF